jgi:hypothetical protein
LFSAFTAFTARFFSAFRSRFSLTARSRVIFAIVCCRFVATRSPSRR